jgi:TonB family protein
MIRLLWLILIVVSAALGTHAQAPADSSVAPPLDAAGLVESAKRLYDLNAPELKPWHLKASYQLYDKSGKPTDSGTFEYWWGKPGMFRKTWTRTNASYSVWRFGMGTARLAVGEEPGYLEHRLERALLQPFPQGFKLDADKVDLEERSVDAGIHLRCVMQYPRLAVTAKASIGFFPTYCFAEQEPILLARYSYGVPVEEFGEIIKAQGRYIPKQVRFIKNKKNVLTASVDAMEGISESDPAFTPPLRAQSTAKTLPIAPVSTAASSSGESGTDVARKLQRVFTLAPSVLGNMGAPPVKMVQPVYPLDAKQAHIAGVVRIQAAVGDDGQVYDMRVLSAPTISMAASALDAVAQWKYKPVEMQGVPVEVESIVSVVFQLGQFH